mmetsp:Transcript_58870/g.91611  ORF Transcript_58870/g.91611 Transcript_58870/m.91611 type:complete len:91 (+) Transcript_58870:16-288(+)
MPGTALLQKKATNIQATKPHAADPPTFGETIFAKRVAKKTQRGDAIRTSQARVAYTGRHLTKTAVMSSMCCNNPCCSFELQVERAVVTSC